MIGRAGFDPFDREGALGLTLPKKLALKFRPTGERQCLVWSIDARRVSHRGRKGECEKGSGLEFAVARFNGNTTGCRVIRLSGRSGPGQEPPQNKEGTLHSCGVGSCLRRCASRSA